MFRFRWKRTLLWVLGVGALPVVLVWGQVEDRVGGPFELRPATRAEVRAEVAGFLKEVPVGEGDRVSPGQRLATLEVPDLSSRIARKQAELREAEAGLRLLEAGPRYEEITEQRRRVERLTDWRDLAGADLDRSRRALREDLARLDAEITQHEAEAEYNQEAMERSRELRARGGVSDQELRMAQTRAKVAQAQEGQARAEKRGREILGTREAEEELARRGKELADAQAALRLLEAGTRPEEIEAARARRARLQEELRYLEGLQEKVRVCSPVTGLVTTPRLREKVRQYFQEGELICVVEEPAVLEVEIPLAEQDAARVRPGQVVELRARGLPFETFHAEVVRVAPAATSAEPAPYAPRPVRGELPGTVTVTCRLLEASSVLRPGMTGHARIDCGRRPLGAILAERAAGYLRLEFWW